MLDAPPFTVGDEEVKFYLNRVTPPPFLTHPLEIEVPISVCSYASGASVRAAGLSPKTRVGVGELQAVGIGDGNNVPVVVLGQCPDLRIGGGQEVVDQVGGSGRANPLTGVHVSLHENPLVAAVEGDLDTPDQTALVRLANDESGHDSRISRDLLIEEVVDLVHTVIRLPADSAGLH